MLEISILFFLQRMWLTTLSILIMRFSYFILLLPLGTLYLLFLYCATLYLAESIFCFFTFHAACNLHNATFFNIAFASYLEEHFCCLFLHCNRFSFCGNPSTVLYIESGWQSAESCFCCFSTAYWITLWYDHFNVFKLHVAWIMENPTFVIFIYCYQFFVFPKYCLSRRNLLPLRTVNSVFQLSVRNCSKGRWRWE